MTSKKSKLCGDNITYCLKEKDENNANLNLTNLLKEFEELNIEPPVLKHENYYDDNNEFNYNSVPYYEFNNVKQLNLIREYYGFNIKTKLKKPEIIQQIISFENDPLNFEIIMKRKMCWFYISELKNDKFMKQFLLW